MGPLTRGGLSSLYPLKEGHPVLKGNDLTGVKPGDRLLIRLGNWRGYETILPVERLTATQIVLTGTAMRFRRSDGRGVAGGGSAHIPTPEDLHRIKLRRVRSYLKNVRWDEVSEEATLAAYALLQENPA
jgi:ABC-type branched-subunit amino acid transport system ATPase component